MTFLILLLLLIGAWILVRSVTPDLREAWVAAVGRLRHRLGLQTMAELQRQAAAEVLRRAPVSVSARYLPNEVLVLLNPDDVRDIGELSGEFCRGIGVLLEAATREGTAHEDLPYKTMGRIEIRVKADARIDRGTVGITAAVSENTVHLPPEPAASSFASGALLELASAERRIDLPGNGALQVGRGHDADLHLDLLEVSRTQAQIHCNGMTVTLVHTGTHPNTFVNGVPVRRAQLSVGDKVSFGPVEFTVELGERARHAIEVSTEPLPS